MGYRVFNAEGEHIAGDGVLDDVVKAAALLVDGWVEDDAGEVVYNSPGHVAAQAQEAEAREAAKLATGEEPSA